MVLQLLFSFGVAYVWVVLAVLLGILYWYLSVPKDIPPGTAGIPILGYLPFAGKTPHLTYTKLGKKFGSIFHVYYGSQLVIILNDYVAVKEAFVKQAELFAGRTRDGNFVKSDSDRHGIVNDDGEHWRQHRRFVLTNLRDNGIGKLSLEPLLMNEIKCFLGELEKNSGKSVPLKDLLYCTISNNVNLLVTGHRYEYTHPTIQRMIRALDSFAEHGQPVAYHTFLPWISRIPGANRILKHEERWHDMTELISIARGFIGDPNRARNISYNNIVDCYLAELKEKKETKDENSIFSMSGLLHICRDLLTAGTETVSRTLLWGMIYLTNNPEAQKKAQKELDRVIGHERVPSYNDRVNTPYVVAMITEIHRICGLIPLSLPHRNIRETRLMGYRIPKDCVIIPNISNIHTDPKLWGDPENFRPERFLGSDGKLFVPEYFIPFSTGKRMCAGEPLARMELYLYFASLLLKFNFVSLDGSKLPTEASEKVTRSPLFDNICVTLRNDVD